MISIDHKENISRIIYVWRRYEGTRAGIGKTFGFCEIDELENRINDYWDHPDKFDWNEGKVIDE
ncbi:hypothetical protein ACFL43_00415 [Thermodesulfobacteriota bacterium]